MYYPKKDYKFIQFYKSPRKTKKYRAVLQNKKTLKIVYVDFGAIRPNGEPYEQYKDTTGLNIYGDYNHGDKARRKRYRKRHGVNSIKPYSPNYFSWKFLW